MIARTPAFPPGSSRPAAAPRILCVDAQPEERLDVCAALAAPGRTVEAVGSVPEALALLAAHPHETPLLVVDDDPPAADALALLAAARARGFSGRTVVLCNDLPSDRAAAFRALRQVCVLVKPVPPAFLRAAAATATHLAA